MPWSPPPTCSSSEVSLVMTAVIPLVFRISTILNKQLWTSDSEPRNAEIGSMIVVEGLNSSKIEISTDNHQKIVEIVRQAAS